MCLRVLVALKFSLMLFVLRLFLLWLRRAGVHGLVKEVCAGRRGAEL